jgi:hypothetical protein
VFFLGLSWLICSISSEVCFLLGWGAEMIPESVVGCAGNMVNTVVFVDVVGVGVVVSEKMTFLEIFDMYLVVFVIFSPYLVMEFWPSW